MHLVHADRPWSLYGVAATRRIEAMAQAMASHHTLMQRAGLATARLALAIAPHARTIWVACGPGNNGGDGLECAMHLARWGKQVVVTLAGEPTALPADAALSWHRFQAAGLVAGTGIPAQWDLCIDALLGIGATRPLLGAMAFMAEAMTGGPVLAVDIPSGLSADTGTGASVQATHTLSFLTLKPGLFTAQGRDAAGQVWFDDLGAAATGEPPTASLAGPSPSPLRSHASHKGSYGDVAVIGGAEGMLGAAQLAASAALHAGAGRVFLAPLDPAAGGLIGSQPELMVRPWTSLPLPELAVACGCGGGSAVQDILSQVLEQAGSLVLDADALNAIATRGDLRALVSKRSGRSLPTVVTPHPLEAARLLGTTTAEVQSDRLTAAQQLADELACVVVLKGSGTVTAAPGRTPVINPTGNARLATGGTGDVLAGWLAALLAQGLPPFEVAQRAVFLHGQCADTWPAGTALTASALAAKAGA